MNAEEDVKRYRGELPSSGDCSLHGGHTLSGGRPHAYLVTTSSRTPPYDRPGERQTGGKHGVGRTGRSTNRRSRAQERIARNREHDAFRIPMSHSPPATAKFRSRYVTGGDPENHVLIGLVLHFIYGTGGACFSRSRLPVPFRVNSEKRSGAFSPVSVPSLSCPCSGPQSPTTGFLMPSSTATSTLFSTSVAPFTVSSSGRSTVPRSTRHERQSFRPPCSECGRGATPS